MKKYDFDTVSAYAEHNAQVIFEQFDKDWKRICCLFKNGLADIKETYEVYHKYKEMAEVFHCYEEYDTLLIKSGIKEV